jgi:ribonuclease VapC
VSVTKTYVLDASAVLALLRQETGHERVTEVWSTAIISAVNLSEVVAKLADFKMPAPLIALALQDAREKAIDFDVGQAFEAGVMRPLTSDKGLSLGDRACLALALARGGTAITADRVWRDINVGIEIEVIR